MDTWFHVQLDQKILNGLKYRSGTKKNADQLVTRLDLICKFKISHPINTSLYIAITIWYLTNLQMSCTQRNYP